jgi:Pseudouridylate synthases, 23S RNA-specific
MKVLFQDENLIAIDKPAGFHVHPHEERRHRVPREQVCLYAVRDLVGKHVYPVHRLDAGTSGVLIFALSSDAARTMCELFNERTVKKTYRAVVRGFVKETDSIALPLELDSTGTPVDALTEYRRLATKEFAVKIGNRFPTARYSLVEVYPHTGRYHQIRRHFNRISHPLLGDAEHGDTRHNQFFRNELGIDGLCLRATGVSFKHPWSGEELLLKTSDSDFSNENDAAKWNKIHLLFPH